MGPTRTPVLTECVMRLFVQILLATFMFSIPAIAGSTCPPVLYGKGTPIKINDKLLHRQNIPPDDEFRIGVAYALGHGVNPDMKASAEWFTRAANHGSVGAQLDLGLMYRHGC